MSQHLNPLPSGQVARLVVFEGRVQGVGFRYTVKELARGFDVRGRVKNLPDGSVELLAAGDAGEVDEFIREILVESPVARNVRTHRVECVPVPEQLSGFRIEH
jgi:acylphosphatase